MRHALKPGEEVGTRALSSLGSGSSLPFVFVFLIFGFVKKTFGGGGGSSKTSLLHQLRNSA